MYMVSVSILVANTYTFIVLLLVNDILAYLLTHLKIERTRVRLQGGKSFIYLSLAFLRTVGARESIGGQERRGRLSSSLQTSQY